MVKIQRDVKQLKEAWDGVDFVTELFSVPRFPRNVATGATARGQRTVHSRDEAMKYFEASLYEDCYMNAYLNYDEMVQNGQLPPGFKPVPNHIIVDLDREPFNSDEELEAALNTTLQNVKASFTGISAEHPIVIWSGNGYHIHVCNPGFTTPLEDMPEFGAWKDDKDLPNKFLRWAERTLSNGMADQHHNPSIKSALFRVPGTFNSKARAAGKDPQVRLVKGIEYAIHRITEEQSLPDIEYYEGIASRPTQKFLNAFQGHLIQELIDSKVVKLNHRTFNMSRHIGTDNGLVWIDKLLNIGVGDNRKNLILWVLAPYLITVKNTEYDKAYHIIEAWLQKCEEVRSLEPGWTEFRYRIRHCLDTAENQERMPIKYETFKEYYPNVYKQLSKGVDD